VQGKEPSQVIGRSSGHSPGHVVSQAGRLSEASRRSPPQRVGSEKVQHVRGPAGPVRRFRGLQQLGVSCRFHEHARVAGAGSGRAEAQQCKHELV
jgi:hypothetical protein